MLDLKLNLLSTVYIEISQGCYFMKASHSKFKFLQLIVQHTLMHVVHIIYVLEILKDLSTAKILTCGTYLFMKSHFVTF